MSVELNRLMEKVVHMDIQLIAGEKGLNNIVSWIHMIETKEASDFLEGGEIAFTTGIGLNSGLSLMELVEDIWKHKASGLVLNIGPFLESVPNEIITFANANNFPIFTVPWKTHIAEIMHIFSYAITRSEQHQLEIAAAFKNAIFFPKQEELYLIPLSQHGYQSTWNYYVCSASIFPAERLELIVNNLDNYLQHLRYKRYALFNFENQIIIITANYTDNRIKDFTSSIILYFNDYLKPGEKYYIGIGKRTKSIRCIYKSYNQAVSIRQLQEKGKLNSQIITYSDMGIYKLLLGIEDKDIINEYYEKTLLSLEKYDESNNTDLCFVLKSYLKNNGSVQNTADELYVHRNTINYKLNKASEILNLNLSNLDTRLQLSIGFMLKDIM